MIAEPCSMNSADRCNSAEEGQLSEALDAAKGIIDQLIERLRARSAAETAAARAALHDMIVRVRGRETPADLEAVARREKVLSTLLDLPAMASAHVRGWTQMVEEKLRQADEARNTYLTAEAAHGEVRFDREKLQAYNEATTSYGEAESALTECLEKLTASFATFILEPARSEALPDPGPVNAAAPAVAVHPETEPVRVRTNSVPSPEPKVVGLPDSNEPDVPVGANGARSTLQGMPKSDGPSGLGASKPTHTGTGDTEPDGFCRGDGETFRGKRRRHRTHYDFASLAVRRRP